MHLKTKPTNKLLLTCLAIMLLSIPAAFAQTTFAKWTFENLTIGPGITNNPPNGWCTNIAADIGSGTASGFHFRNIINTFSTPAGNGSSKSLSANQWTNSPSDFWQFAVSTLNYHSITLTFDQVGSGTGPRDFALQYSVDGGATFTTFTSYSLPNITSWSATATNSGSSQSFDLSAVTALDHVSTVYFRLANTSTANIGGTSGGTTGTAGTDRIDNFAVSGVYDGPPIIFTQPISTNIFFGDSTSFSVIAGGSIPLDFRWYYYTNGATTTNLLSDGSSGYGSGTISGSSSSVLSLSLVNTNQAGNYFVVVSNSLNTATSQVVQLNVGLRPVIVTNIAYLHTLHNANYVLTDTTNLYEVQGVVTTVGDLVASGGQSAFFQDGTGGMDLFFFTPVGYTLPNQGDRIRVRGQLSQFQGALEIQLTTNPSHQLEVLSSGNALPTPRYLDFTTINVNAMEGYTNNDGSIVSAYEGAYVIISNVFLGITNTGGNLNLDQTIYCTNLTGQVFQLRVPNNSLCDAFGNPLPGSYAKSVRGALAQFTTAAVPTNNYAIYLDMRTNIEVALPPAPKPTIKTVSYTGGNIVLSGTNNDTSGGRTYYVLASTNITLPLSQWTSLVTNTFDGAGNFTETFPVGSNAQLFYTMQVP